MKYAEPWKEHRKMFQQHFHPLNTESYQPKEQEYIHKLLKRLHESPDNFLDHIRQYVQPLYSTLFPFERRLVT